MAKNTLSLIRTEKEFSKENLPLDFLRRALSIAGLNSIPLKFELEDFELEECWEGFKPGGTRSPWSDDCIKEGWEKRRSATRIKHKRSFDTFATIFEQKGTIQGYFKESLNRQYAGSQLDWVNLLIEYGFVTIKTN